MREDGLRVDRLLLTTDTTYIPVGPGPGETIHSGLALPLSRTIHYSYDDLYRLTNASYNTGDVYTYTYDALGNRTRRGVNGVIDVYTYDAANRLLTLNGTTYSWDDNGNLLNDGIRAYTFTTGHFFGPIVYRHHPHKSAKTLKTLPKKQFITIKRFRNHREGVEQHL